MPRSRYPDAYVTATDRNGRVLARREFNGSYILMAEKIGKAKLEFIQRFGPDTYTFVNVYC